MFAKFNSGSLFIPSLAILCSVSMLYGYNHADAKKRNYIFVWALVVGVPFGVITDHIAPIHDGPDCGMVGIPIILVMFGYLGVFVREVVNNLRDN